MLQRSFVGIGVKRRIVREYSYWGYPPVDVGSCGLGPRRTAGQRAKWRQASARASLYEVHRHYIRPNIRL